MPATAGGVAGVAGEQPRMVPPSSPGAGPGATPVAHVDERREIAARNRAGIKKNVDHSSTFTLLIGALAFLAFFVAVSLFILLMTRANAARVVEDDIAQDIRNQVASVTSSLNDQITWFGNARAATREIDQTVNFIARGSNVAGVAVIDGNNKLLTGTQNAAPLSRFNLNGFPQTGVVVTSLISPEGDVTPVIGQKIDQNYLLVALNPGTLTNAGQSGYAVVERNGRVVDGPKHLGRVGTAEYYNIPADRLSSLMNSNSPQLVQLDINGKKSWLAINPIPNSSLSVVTSRSATGVSGWKTIGFLLALLFAGTCSVIYIFMRNMVAQIDRVEKTHTDTEVSEQRYRAAIDGSRGGVWEMNLAENEAYLSRSLARLLGLADSEMTISVPHFLGLFREVDRERLLHFVRRAHMMGDFETDLGVARLPITLSIRGRPSTRGVDNVRVVIGMGIDVTEQRGAQARLEAAEARLFDALRSMNDSFVIWNQRDQLVLWNARFEDFFGFDAGTLSKGVDHATVQYSAQQNIEERIDIGGGHGYEIRLKDGRWIRYLETSTADGGRVSIGTDVTAIRTREHQLQENETALQRTIDVLKKSQRRIVELAESYEQEKIRAEQANQSKSEFLANMSHELRTPLNAINGFSDIMQKEMFGPLGDPRYKEYVSDILFSGQHLLSLINDILDMSKIEAGKMNLNVEAVNMNDIIAQVIRIVRGRAEDNRLKIVYDEADLPEIEADPRNVKQVLLNLMTNAIKFTPENGVVSVNVTVKSAGLIIAVSDTGIGIAKDDIERLAKPFEQIDSQHSRKHEGTGLGLALSKSLIEMHGGNFKIESVEGEGTTVTFTLPNKPLQQAKETEETEVADEISRLAQDIADVLDGSASEDAPVKTHEEFRPTRDESLESDIPIEEPDFAHVAAHQQPSYVEQTPEFNGAPPVPDAMPQPAAIAASQLPPANLDNPYASAAMPNTPNPGSAAAPMASDPSNPYASAIGVTSAPPSVPPMPGAPSPDAPADTTTLPNPYAA